MCYPEGCAAPGSVPCQCNTRGLLSKLEETPPQTKINVTSKSPVGDISVVTLIRTDTTLDHSQKAEKVWSGLLEFAVPRCVRVQEMWLNFVPQFIAPGFNACPQIPRQTGVSGQRLHRSYTSPFMHLPLLKAC